MHLSHDFTHTLSCPEAGVVVSRPLGPVEKGCHYGKCDECVLLVMTGLDRLPSLQVVTNRVEVRQVSNNVQSKIRPLVRKSVRCVYAQPEFSAPGGHISRLC